MKLHGAWIFAAVLTVAVGLAGCTTFKADGLAMIPSNGVQTISHFEKEVVIHKFVGESGGTNLFNITAEKGSDAVANAIAEEVKKAGGDGAVNVSGDVIKTGK